MKTKTWVIPLIILVLLIIIFICSFYTNKQQENTDNFNLNTNISNVTCNGSGNILTINSGYAIIRFGILDKDKQNVIELEENGNLTNLYSMFLPSINGKTIFNESYYDTNSSLLDSGGSIDNNFNLNTREFLAILNASLVNSLHNQINSWQVEHEAVTIFVNPVSEDLENKPKLIYYTCKLE